MSSIMRRRNGLIAWSVMGRLLSGGRVATPHLQTGRASYLSPPRAPGGGALPRERFSPMIDIGSCVHAVSLFAISDELKFKAAVAYCHFRSRAPPCPALERSTGLPYWQLIVFSPHFKN